jgi:hypothetical protein
MFAERIESARLAARKVAVVTLGRDAANRKAWRLVRANAPASRPGPGGREALPTPGLF